MTTNNITEIEEFVKENYQKLGPKYIADVYGTYKCKITRIAKKFGLKMSGEQRSKLCIKAFEKSPNEFSVNHLNFENVKSPEVAYLLGFLWADGCVTECGRGKSIRCSIVEDDGNEIKKTFLDTGNWRIYNGKIDVNHPTWKPKMTLYTNNKHLFNYLEKMGYRDKTGLSPDKILNTVPNELKHYWWRGFFDGDGCVNITKNNGIQIIFSGPFEQDWNFVKELMLLLEIRKYTIMRNVSNKNHKSSGVRFCSKSDVFKFFSYIYKNREDDKIGLDRKYKKFQTFDFSYKQPKRERKNLGCFGEKLYVSDQSHL